MTKSEIESALDSKIIETWNQPAQERIEKFLASRRSIASLALKSTIDYKDQPAVSDEMIFRVAA